MLPDIGKLIRSYRSKQGLSLHALAQQIGVTYQTIQHWEKGRNLPTLPHFVAVTKALDIKIFDLVDKNTGSTDFVHKIARSRINKKNCILKTVMLEFGIQLESDSCKACHDYLDGIIAEKELIVEFRAAIKQILERGNHHQNQKAS